MAHPLVKQHPMLSVETDVQPLVKKAQEMEDLQACRMIKQLFTLGIEYLNKHAVKVKHRFKHRLHDLDCIIVHVLNPQRKQLFDHLA